MTNGQRFTTLGFFLTLILFLSGCTENKPTPIETPLEKGQLLFSNQCAMCHGMQGEGTSMMLAGKNIHFNQAQWQGRLSDSQILNVIKNGRANMPNFVLSPDEEVALLAYIRSLSTK